MKQDYNKKFKYANGSKWPCYSSKALQTMYKGKNYQVVGEVIHKKGKNRSMPLFDDDNKALYIQPLGTYKHLLYRPYAYLPYEEDTYVIVKKSNVLYLTLLVLVILLMVAGLFWKFTSTGPALDPNAGDYKGSLKRPANWDSSSILIPGYDDLKMEAGTDILRVSLVNPDENPCYFKFTIILKETNETLFTTGFIPPGKAVTTVKLPRKFEKGIYPVIIRVNSYSLKDYELELNGGEVAAQIVALAGK